MKVKNYVLTEEIGIGAFSTVYRAHLIDNENQLYAIKSIRNIAGIDEKVQSQIELLCQIKHKNIVEFIESIHQKEKGKWYIVLEYCGKGDLQNYFKNQGRQSEKFCKNLAFAIISALSELHTQSIAHRDLKLSNILINDEYDFKIADFGMARAETDGLLQSFCGTPYAMAPQILRKQKYDTKCDTWSLGVMIYQLALGKIPFNVTTGGFVNLTKLVLQTQPCYNIPGVSVSDNCIDFIKQCLKKNAKQRPSMKSLIEHPWLQSEIGSKIRVQMLQGSFERNSNKVLKQKAENQIKQIFQMIAQQHVKKIVKQYKLIEKHIADLLAIFDKFYPQHNQIRTNLLLMIAVIIKQLDQKKIIIEIEDKKFEVHLSEVKSFKNHINNLKCFLSAQTNSNLQKIDQNMFINIQHTLIYFTTNEAQSCINLTENYPDKVKLLHFISQLPIRKPLQSRITVKWCFNDDNANPQKLFNDQLQKITNQEVCKFINSSVGFEEKQKNWIIQHYFPKAIRDGPEISVGQFISKIIEMNYCGQQ